jgi:spermidine/putrescine transport system substrate-binding protein
MDEVTTGRMVSGLSRRQFIGRSAGVALSVGGLGAFVSACGGGDDGDGGEVVVVSWAGDYLSPELSKILKEEAGLTLKAVPSESDQDMFTKVKAGGGGAYDIVFANCGWSPTYYDNDLIEAFGVDEVANGRELWPIFRENTDLPYVIEPNKLILFPNMWDSLSMIWNTGVDFQPGEPYSWRALWDPAVPEGKVIFKGAPEDYLSIAGLALGVPKEQIYAMEGDQLTAAAEHLAALKPFQIAGSDGVFDRDLTSGKAWIGQSPSLAAESRINATAGRDVVRAVTPQEGSLGWVDGPQLVKGAKNRRNAFKFMEVWNGERWQTHLFEKLGYAQCNEVATRRVLAEGGAAAQNVRDRGGDDPEQVTELVFQGPPKDPAAWTQAYDQVVGG